MSRIPTRSILWLLVAGLAFGCANTIVAQRQSRLKHKPAHVKSGKPAPTTAVAPAQPKGEVIGKRIRFSDGSVLEADEVWKQGEEFWCRTGGMARRIDQPIQTIDPIHAEPKKEPAKIVEAPAVTANSKNPAAVAFWIYLKGGARMKVDDVSEKDGGAWYRRDSLSIFIERDRIERIERDSPAAAKRNGWQERDWTSGNARIDELIRGNAARFGLDPYLVFCVIEHESHFRARAVSPKGARGLMQLMPGTASRFGVRKSFDPAENIFGGTQYLKELLQMFGGRLDLALASYNAGEGAVIKYGRNVPPYRETRDYVKRITRRYGAGTPDPGEKVSPLPR